MATEGTERGEREDNAAELQRYMVETSRAGYDDVLYTDADAARRILTEKRIQIIETLTEEEVESIRDLARRLDRHVSTVKEDLDVLSQEQVVEYEQQGQRKVPTLKHPNVIVKPILLNGTVTQSG
jgi:predicted transcriptional regulator